MCVFVERPTNSYGHKEGLKAHQYWRGNDLGDNCIQNFHLGRYIVGYTFGNHVLWLRLRMDENVISERISKDLPPQMKILNMVIPILMHN